MRETFLDLHGTFLIFLGCVAVTHYLAQRSVAEAFHALLFIIVLFGVVVLHELGHALTANRLQSRGTNLPSLLPSLKGITLFPPSRSRTAT